MIIQISKLRVDLILDCLVTRFGSKAFGEHVVKISRIEKTVSSVHVKTHRRFGDPFPIFELKGVDRCG
jgi:hypothetical protein